MSAGGSAGLLRLLATLASLHALKLSPCWHTHTCAHSAGCRCVCMWCAHAATLANHPPAPPSPAERARALKTPETHAGDMQTHIGKHALRDWLMPHHKVLLRRLHEARLLPPAGSVAHLDGGCAMHPLLWKQVLGCRNRHGGAGRPMPHAAAAARLGNAAAAAARCARRPVPRAPRCKSAPSCGVDRDLCTLSYDLFVCDLRRACPQERRGLARNRSGRFCIIGLFTCIRSTYDCHM